MVHHVSPVTSRPSRLVLLLATVAVAEAQPRARTSGATPAPCDILSAGGTPCVAAHSLVRALFAKFTGTLYTVKRSSDGRILRVGVGQNGFADASAQETFCTGTSCIVQRILDQTAYGNHLDPAPGGGAPGSAWFPDKGVNASRAPITLSGHAVYGAFFHGKLIDGDAFRTGEGYRNDNTSGIASIPSGPRTVGYKQDTSPRNSRDRTGAVTVFSVSSSRLLASLTTPVRIPAGQLETLLRPSIWWSMAGITMVFAALTMAMQKLTTMTMAVLRWRRLTGARQIIISRTMAQAQARG